MVYIYDVPWNIRTLGPNFIGLYGFKTYLHTPCFNGSQGAKTELDTKLLCDD